MSTQLLLGIYGILLLIFAVVLLLTVRQVGVLSLRIGPSGSRTTADGPALHGEQLSSRFVQQLLGARPEFAGGNLLVAFVSPYCLGCRLLLPVLKTVADEERKHLNVVAVSRSVAWQESADLKKNLGSRVCIVEDEQLFEEWNVHGTPYCVLLDKSGRVAAKGIANTPEHMESLLTALEMGTPTFEDYVEQRLLPQERESAESRPEVSS